MKKFIIVVLMLCMMIPTCFAASNGFADNAVYVINNLNNVDSKLTYAYTDYTDYNDSVINSITIIYYSNTGMIYVAVNESNAYAKWYTTDSLAGIIVNAPAAVKALVDVYGFVADVVFINSGTCNMVYGTSWNTKRTIESIAVTTTFDDFTNAVIEYGVDATGLLRIYSELY